MPIWVFPKIVVPQNGWCLMETPIKMDDLGVPLYLEPPIFRNKIVQCPSVPKIKSKKKTMPDSMMVDIKLFTNISHLKCTGFHSMLNPSILFRDPSPPMDFWRFPAQSSCSKSSPLLQCQRLNIQQP